MNFPEDHLILLVELRSPFCLKRYPGDECSDTCLEPQHTAMKQRINYGQHNKTKQKKRMVGRMRKRKE